MRRTIYRALLGTTGVPVDGAASYMLTDHLGSASVVLDANGAMAAARRYPPSDEARQTGEFPTDRLFAGQRRLAAAGEHRAGDVGAVVLPQATCCGFSLLPIESANLRRRQGGESPSVMRQTHLSRTHIGHEDSRYAPGARV